MIGLVYSKEMLVQEHPFVAAMHVLYRSGYLHCNASVLHSVEPSGLALIAHRSLTSKRFSLRSWPDLLYRQSSRRPVIAKAASAELTAEVQVSAPEAAGFTDFQLDDRVTVRHTGTIPVRAHNIITHSTQTGT